MTGPGLQVAAGQAEGSGLRQPVAQQDPKAFYASWRLRDVERHVLRLLASVQHKLEEGVLAAPFQPFPLQEPAFRFADTHELASELR